MKPEVTYTLNSLAELCSKPEVKEYRVITFVTPEEEQVYGILKDDHIFIPDHYPAEYNEYLEYVEASSRYNRGKDILVYQIGKGKLIKGGIV